MPPWLTPEVLGWLGLLSAVMFIATLFAVPWFLARLPPDYFIHRERYRKDPRHPALRLFLRIAKNLLGFILLLAGIAMLVLPGQGLLTIAVGLMLIDFPGKERLEARMLHHPKVIQAINWVRARAHQPPLILEEEHPEK
ncbi:MAG: hypothetical protein D6819_04025 [Gammaproteobacteria bacterium]|nr:MAG: hypothetical protein D6819_04025 [Gammaproteobacteria bacterium]